MPSNYFSRLRGSFRQGIQRSYVVLEDSFVDSLGVLPVQGKLLYNKPGFYYRTFAAFSDLNILFQRGNPVAAQSNLKSTSQGKNLSVVGAVSRTLSIPSVSGPPFQVCGYHIDNLLTGHHKLPRALTGSNALLGRYYPNKSTVSRGHLYSSNGNSREFHNGWQISTSLRNKVQPDSYFLHGYSKTSVCIGSECENLHTTSATCLSASTASDMSFDHSVCDDQHASSIDSKDRMAPEGRSLKLLSGSCSLPHPEKEETGGEDAHFICSDKRAIGVADGVGGWVDHGVDAAIYARELMFNSLSAVQDEPTGYTDPARVLEIAHANTKAKGSSTACIIALTDQGLRAFNLGDSGFMVIRDGYTVFRSPAQQHTFNYTYQLANGGIGDSPSAGQVFSISVAPGDVIVAGTDGLFDNLYNNDITAVVVHAVRAGFGPQVMAQKIAALARQRAQDKDRQTPFSAAAQEAGFRYYGGKLDDITVVVSYITTSKYDESIPSSLA
uniref:probable protein phosphatase 2C 55 isoform X1 n=1 Tax=Erigeron canadensis TaxID=72917 RepID=UPI001CB92740|nr:probable protein phosphatase 2C 55 isoform X1 [Erigeron canadensis]